MPSSGPASPELIFDTGALVTLAVDDDLWDLAKARFGGRARYTLTVRDELKRLRGNRDVARFAKKAFNDVAWLGEPVRQDSYEERQAILEFRDIIASGKLGHPNEHLGEASCLVYAMGTKCQMIAEDHHARALASDCSLVTASVHTLLHQWVRAKVISAADAVAFAYAINAVDRGPTLTATELMRGGDAMGRVGCP